MKIATRVSVAATGLLALLGAAPATEASIEALAATTLANASIPPSPAGTDDLFVAARARSTEEAQLLAVLRAIDQGELERARRLARALVAQVPTFTLAQALVDALREADGDDLPALREQWLGGRGGSCADGALRDVCAEARLRWDHRNFSVPAVLPPVWHLDAAIRHLILVETDAHRLYLFSHGEEGFRLLRDVYISVGSDGTGKTREGDGRTPLGVYFTLSRMEGEGLAPRYGAHAFPLDYPNAWDRRRAYTGRGIWLHGVPADTYSRPPLDSDGCVVLSNRDIRWLAKRVDPLRTPVIVTRSVPWGRGRSGASQERAALLAQVDAWYAAWRQGGERWADAARSLYEATVEPVHPAIRKGAAAADAVRDARRRRLMVVQDPAQPALVAVTFEDARRRWFRQHWRRDGTNRWRIVAERAPSAPRR